jgi:hypothetical protein
VLPLKAGEKAPLSEVVPDSRKDASTEIDLIGVWWSSHPEFCYFIKILIFFINNLKFQFN